MRIELTTLGIWDLRATSCAITALEQCAHDLYFREAGQLALVQVGAVRDSVSLLLPLVGDRAAANPSVKETVFSAKGAFCCCCFSYFDSAAHGHQDSVTERLR